MTYELTIGPDDDHANTISWGLTRDGAHVAAGSWAGVGPRTWGLPEPADWLRYARRRGVRLPRGLRWSDAAARWRRPWLRDTVVLTWEIQ